AERFGLKPTPQITPGKRILISFAGPFVGIVLGVVSIVVASIVHAPQDSALARVMADLVWVNLGWGVLNLVPMLPLDGGNIVASVAELVVPSRRHARIAAHGLSVLVAVGLGVLVLTYARSAWNVMLVALLGWQNVVALRALLSPPEDPPGGGRPSGGPGPGRSPGGEAGGPPQGPDFH
ncbi:MAG: site-2 protease family protein, partial [Polyangiales bacterium]